jgi:hypothetical protein
MNTILIYLGLRRSPESNTFRQLKFWQQVLYAAVVLGVFALLLKLL